MASTKGKKKKMFKVTGSLLVQILKICLNTQFHKKTLNKRKKKKKNPFFFKFPRESIKRQMAQMRGSPLRQDLNNCFCFDKGVYIVNYVMTLFSQEKGPQRREKDT